MTISFRLRMVCLFMLAAGLVAMTASSQAAESQVRVGLVEGVVSLTVSSADALSLRLPSGKSYRASGSVFIRRNANGWTLNDREVSDPQVRIVGQGEIIQLRAGKRADGSGEERTWQVLGPIELAAVGNGMTVISLVPLEEYVGGVVSGEVSPNWPLESLKAQAVAARTYVMYKKMENQQQLFDVLASVQDQVYHGHSVRPESIQQAIQSTLGQVLTYDNRPIFAAYSSTAAGPTEDALYVWALDLPYLKGVACPFDEQAPRYEWQTAFTFDDLERQLRKEGYDVGTVATLTPYTLTPSGRVDRVRILHSKGEVILRGQDLRRVIGYSKIFSTQFTIQKLGAEVVIVGRGAGHAVGLCQWGMREMANLGYDYQSILRHYYPGTTLLPLTRVLLTSAN
ncbi:MAG: SpoIID/LytB domain-containing protein [Nitrospirales bacterium]|nr:SpoIID/LytB domain-containing protein [Nitrospirales bacterium]